MILPYRDFGAAQEDVLAGSCPDLVLVYLNLNDVGGMLYDFCYESFVMSSDLSQDSLQ